MSLAKRALLGAPFILAAHWYIFPRSITLGIIVDIIGVTIIYNPFRRRASRRVTPHVTPRVTRIFTRDAKRRDEPTS